MKLSYISSKKVFLIFQEMELFGLRLKNFLIFFQKKAFLIFRETELSSTKNFPSWKNEKTHSEKKFILFWEMQLSSPKVKKLLYF